MTLHTTMYSLNRCDKECNFSYTHISIFLSQNLDINSESEPNISQIWALPYFMHEAMYNIRDHR